MLNEHAQFSLADAGCESGEHADTVGTDCGYTAVTCRWSSLSSESAISLVALPSRASVTSFLILLGAVSWRCMYCRIYPLNACLTLSTHAVAILDPMQASSSNTHNTTSAVLVTATAPPRLGRIEP